MSGTLGMKKKRSRHASPAEERRRWLALQAICLIVLALITAFLVFKALTMP